LRLLLPERALNGRTRNVTKPAAPFPPRAGQSPWMRRGCFALLLGIIVVLAALAAIGFSADPINDLDIKIPTTG
jgi:hypothetical protein